MGRMVTYPYRANEGIGLYIKDLKGITLIVGDVVISSDGSTLTL
jgi:hypothetical protein